MQTRDRVDLDTAVVFVPFLSTYRDAFKDEGVHFQGLDVQARRQAREQALG